MKATATIQSSRSAGVAMAILGVVILVAVVPFSLFGVWNFRNASDVPALFLIVPIVMGLLGIGSIVIGILQFTGKAKFGRVIEAETSDFAKTAEDRLDELERLKRRDMVSPEEYAAKRQEILKDL